MFVLLFQDLFLNVFKFLKSFHRTEIIDFWIYISFQEYVSVIFLEFSFCAVVEILIWILVLYGLLKSQSFLGVYPRKYL